MTATQATVSAHLGRTIFVDARYAVRPPAEPLELQLEEWDRQRAEAIRAAATEARRQGRGARGR